MKKTLLYASAVALLAACNEKPATPEVPALTMAEIDSVAATVQEHELVEWAKNASIYEVNVRQHTTEGTLAAFTADLDRIADMGIEILWIMPIQPIGVEGRKDPKEDGTSMGSYYSISDYTAVSPDYGTEADFKAMVEKAHSLGMHVILDWVANHTAFDHHWTKDHPEFYSKTEDGSISVALDNDGGVTDWTDVADLNYNEPGLYREMTSEMQWWIDQFDIDGFRCDVAGFVPHKFWQYAIPQLRTSKDIFMLAEWDEPYLHDVFDMSYGWDFHHRTNEVAKGEQPISTFDEYKADVLDSIYPANATKMLFTTNHDENSWNGTVYERYGDAHKAFYVLCATYEQGMPLVYSGQEAGLNHRLEFFYKDEVSWEDRSLEPFYATLIQTKIANKALWNAPYGGEMVRVKTSMDQFIYAFKRAAEGHEVFVLINFSEAPVAFTYEGGVTGTFEEVFTGNQVELTESGEFQIEGNAYMVFSNVLTQVD